MRYLLKGFWQEKYDEVTKEQHQTAKEIVGVPSYDNETSENVFFDYKGISGKVEEEN